jgi:hypothetical protein
MAINLSSEMLHRIRVKLYPNYLPGTQGKYIARTDDEASMSIEQVASEAKNRGGYTGSIEDMVEHVKIYLEEAAHQLSDGYSINNGWYSIHPKVGGTFDKPDDANLQNHIVHFAFRSLKPLRALAARVELVIEGIADVQGYIDQVLNVSIGSIDDSLTPGGMLAVSGHKIKIDGDNPEVGLYLIQQEGGERIPVPGPLAENSASKVIALIPAALAAGTYRLEIVTQYTTGSFILKEPRTISYPVDLTVV